MCVYLFNATLKWDDGFMQHLQGRCAYFKHNNDADTYIQVVRYGSQREHRINMRTEHAALYAQIMPTIPNSIVDMLRRYIYKEPMNNPHFDVEEDIHTTSENYEINGYGHDLDLIITSHQSCFFVSYVR